MNHVTQTQTDGCATLTFSNPTSSTETAKPMSDVEIKVEKLAADVDDLKTSRVVLTIVVIVLFLSYLYSR